MKKFNILLLFLFTLFYTQILAQQQRFLDPIFEDTLTHTNVVYGVNATVIALPIAGEAIPQPLIMDVYQPKNDTMSERPLVLLWHSGTFLPFPQNLQSNGTLRDSAVIDVATKLAQRGYVVASCDYRLGWDPQAPTQDLRKIGIMNAAYRAIQDARTAIRFFKMDVTENDNTFKIDSSKIVLWGIGTGGYISMGCASLEDYVANIAMIPKFNVDLGGPNPVPVVIPSINGDIWGTSVGIAQMYPPFPDGDTLCYPNWVGYDSGFQMAVNMGGAVGDTSWVDENTEPTVSFHVPTDQVSPCTTALVVLPPPLSLAVVEISGSCHYQREQQQYGNHAEWESEDWIDDISAVANSRNNGYEGFLPFLTDSVENNAPWDWWAEDIPDANRPGYPLDVAGAKATIDTALAYFGPRACLTLDLGCDLSGIVPVDDVIAEKIDLQIAPNPAADFIRFQSKEFPIKHIYVYDINGRLVKAHPDINNFEFELQRQNLGNGIYIAQVRFEQGFITKQIIFQN